MILQKLVYLKKGKTSQDINMKRLSRRCYCAFCRKERTVYQKRHLSLVDAALCLFASFCLMLVIWQDFDPKVFVFFAAALGFSEIFVLLRRRMSVPCPHCGFDAVLYKNSQALAAGKVKMHMERRKTEPLSLLAPPPRLPVVVKKQTLRGEQTSIQR
jgi:hypothetical protein